MRLPVVKKKKNTDKKTEKDRQGLCRKIPDGLLVLTTEEATVGERNPSSNRCF